jgi:hypothetical protein
MFPPLTGECLPPCNDWMLTCPRGQVTDYRRFDVESLSHLRPFAVAKGMALVPANTELSRAAADVGLCAVRVRHRLE